MRRIIFSFLMLSLSMSLTASPKVNVVGCDTKAATSFAIFVDTETYNACRAEIDAYRQVLQEEGLGTYIVSSSWERPEQVKEQIAILSRRKPMLEGMVFIGDIPVARIRGAQFMTTAFKMNEEEFPMEESSVTSDRYYDDPHLDFRFICQDSVHNRHFYYNLTAKSAVKVNSSYYSGRIMVPADFPGDRMEVMRKYLRKVVDAHRNTTPLDHFIFFAGHGYNSDCLTVWRQMQVLFKEYFPKAFEKSSGNHFYNFRQEPYMKYRLFSELQRKETDVFMFSEHGAPETQYINGAYPASGLEENVVSLQRELRSMYLRILQRKGQQKADAFAQQCAEEYHISKEIFSEECISASRIADSVARADINISLEDLLKVRTNAKVVIFNACYNGSFHKDGNVAGYHIFGEGDCIVAQGNTVNVLQDKWADQLMGLLSLGLRAGFWQREFSYLESHLIGDPTFRFVPQDGYDASPLARELALSSYSDNSSYWKESLDSSIPVVREVSVRELSRKKAVSTDELLRLFIRDSSWIVRLQCLVEAAPAVDSNAIAIVKRGMNDPFEFIRRESCHLAEKIGAPQFIRPLIKIELSANESIREQYASHSALGIYDPATLPEDFVASHLKSSVKQVKSNLELIFDDNADPEDREYAIRFLRNNPLHWKAREFAALAVDPSVDEDVRLLMGEALGWFCYSIEAPAIASSLKTCLDKGALTPTLTEVLTKSYRRLTDGR